MVVREETGPKLISTWTFPSSLRERVFPCVQEQIRRAVQFMADSLKRVTITIKQSCHEALQVRED